MAGARPGGVTLIAVLTWINGALGVASGVIGLLGGAGTVAWIVLALGVITLAVGVGLLNGSSMARIIATIVFVLNVAAAVYLLFNGGTLWSAIGTGGLSLIALLLLYTARSNAFFKR
jgi:hypothetical protein